jgi:hypothetical protein
MADEGARTVMAVAAVVDEADLRVQALEFRIRRAELDSGRIRSRLASTVLLWALRDQAVNFPEIGIDRGRPSPCGRRFSQKPRCMPSTSIPVPSNIGRPAMTVL